MAPAGQLSLSDVQELLRDPSGAVREQTAAKIAEAFGSGALTAQERTLAEQIFRLMLRDAEARVRAALASNLKDNPLVPRDVALGLARDVAEVAAPILEHSAVLTDADLVEIIRAGNEDKQVAVARRSTLSTVVSGAIADQGAAAAVTTMLRNEGATLDEAAYVRALDRFGDRGEVSAAMALRARLPIGVAERLVTLVSDTLRQHLVAHHDLPPDVATDLVLQSRERATVGLASGSGREDVAALVRRLHRGGRLSATIVLRALCTGDLDFFECAMAELAGIPVHNVYRLIHDGGDLGLARLVEKIGFSVDFLEVARTALQVSRELQYDGRPGDRERFVERMVERVLTYFEDDFEAGNLDYLIGRLDGRRRALAAA